MSSKHDYVAECEIKFQLSGMPDDEREVAYPKLLISYDYVPGRAACTPRGEYGPIDPPDPPEITILTAKLIDGDGLAPTQGQLDDWAQDYADSDAGFESLCNNAEDDRYSLRNVR